MAFFFFFVLKIQFHVTNCQFNWLVTIAASCRKRVCQKGGFVQSCCLIMGNNCSVEFFYVKSRVLLPVVRQRPQGVYLKLTVLVSISASAIACSHSTERSLWH